MCSCQMLHDFKQASGALSEDHMTSITERQRREHYEIEKELAAKLRAASAKDRSHLYTQVYDELFRRVPHHPMLVNRPVADSASTGLTEQIRLLTPYLQPHSRYLEIGPGRCALAFAIAQRVSSVEGVDVSEHLTDVPNKPTNFKLHISNGSDIPVISGSIDIAFSNQLMEHLHPEDAMTQLRGIYRSLRLGGYYICITPNRVSGPHDVSKYFDEVATCFHLKEYTVSELAAVFFEVGFSQVKCLIRVKGRFFAVPRILLESLESMLSLTKGVVRRKLTRSSLVRVFVGNIYVVGLKK